VRRRPQSIVALVVLAVAVVSLQTLLPTPIMNRLHLTSEAATTITFTPSSVSLGVGEETWITIRINDVVDLYGADIRISYNPSIIEVIESVPGVYALDFGTFPYPDWVIRNQADPGAGVIWYATTQTNPRPPVSGSGTLARIHVRGLANGTMNLVFTDQLLANNNGLAIPNEAASCFVQVGTGTPSDTETPTATVTGTSTGTPTLTPVDTPTPSDTPEPSATPTEGPSPTPLDTLTPTLSPTPSSTSTPSLTPTTTPTPSITPTASTRTFAGHVYRGGLSDTSRPIQGVVVQLLGSNVAGHPGTFLKQGTTDSLGHYSITYTGSYPNYSLVEIDPSGYASAGVIPAPGGTAPDSSGNWVEFRNPPMGALADSDFFDYLVSQTSPTPTSSATSGPSHTPGPSPTGGTPGPTAPASDQPTADTRRVAKDTMISLAEANTNYGRQGYLHLGYLAAGPSKNILLWFDLSDVPADAVVMDALVTIFGRQLEGEIPLCLSGMHRDWGEYQATWKESWAGTKWAQDGAMDTLIDRDDMCLLGTFSDGADIDSYGFDITPLMQEWLDGTRPNDGMFIRVAPGSRAVSTLPFYSREYSQPYLRPLLSFTYTRPTQTPTPSPTLSATPTRRGLLLLPLIRKAK